MTIACLTPFTIQPIATLDFQAMMHPSIWGGLLYLGVISTACGFLMWNRGLQMLNASSCGLFFFFQPIVETFLGWLLLGEQIVYVA